MISLYETLRIELGRDIGITIVTPGLIESEMSQGKVLFKEGKMVSDQLIRDVSYLYFLHKTWTQFLTYLLCCFLVRIGTSLV